MTTQRKLTLALVIFVLAMGSLIFAYYRSFGFPASAQTKTAVFLDENTQQFSFQEASAVPPLPAADGPLSLVSAVLSTQHPEPPVLENVLYFYRFTPEAKHALEKQYVADRDMNIAATLFQQIEGKEVRKPAPSSPWVAADSSEGQNIMNPPSP